MHSVQDSHVISSIEAIQTQGKAVQKGSTVKYRFIMFGYSHSICSTRDKIIKSAIHSIEAAHSDN